MKLGVKLIICSLCRWLRYKKKLRTFIAYCLLPISIDVYWTHNTGHDKRIIKLCNVISPRRLKYSMFDHFFSPECILLFFRCVKSFFANFEYFLTFSVWVQCWESIDPYCEFATQMLTKRLHRRSQLTPVCFGRACATFVGARVILSCMAARFKRSNSVHTFSLMWALFLLSLLFWNHRFSLFIRCEFAQFATDHLLRFQFFDYKIRDRNSFKMQWEFEHFGHCSNDFACENYESYMNFNVTHAEYYLYR